ncbi:MAG: MFS transporter [Bacteriovoracaceae bacterium]
MNLIILLFLLVNCFLHGTFASGIIPVLNFYIKENSGFPFSAYFLGIVLGQFLIIANAKLSRKSLSYTFFEVCFGLSLILMGLSTTLTHFIYSRFIEGVFAGLSLPLLFRLVTLNQAIVDKSKKIALFNSVFAVGIVIGPSYVTILNNYFEFSNILKVNGTVFIIINIALHFVIYKMNLFENYEDNNSFLIPLASYLKEKVKLFRNYLTLFYAKFFYGMLLSATSCYFYIYFPSNLSIQKFLLMVSVAFIVGQLIVVTILKFINRKKVDIYSPILAAISLISFVLTKEMLFLFMAVIFQSSLLLVGQLNIGEKPDKIRDFALFNLMTDPGMVLGSTLATLKFNGLVLACLFSLIPMSYFYVSSRRSS